MVTQLPTGKLGQLICILGRADYGPVALFMAVQMVALGLWLLNPWFDTFAASPTYAGMRMAPEWAGGVWFTILGLALLWYTCLSHYHRVRKVVCLATALTWYLCTAVFAYSNPVVLGVVMFATNAITASWLYFRAMMPAHE